MPKYLATIKDQNGASKTMIVEALDRNGAILSIQRQGVFLISLGDVDSSKMAATQQERARKSKFTHNNVTTADIATFAKQVATMLEAGVPLLRTITVIAEQVESRELSRVLFEVRNNVEAGQPFSKSLGKHPKIFSQFWVSLVEVGEASGTMPRVLKQLTEYMEQAEKFQSQIIGALIYPAILLTICTGAILVFALFIGPVFEKIFLDMKMDLPGITIIMLGTFKFIKTKFLLLVAGIVGGAFLFQNYLKTTPGRFMWESFLLNVPGLGPIIRMVIVEKFASQMAILIESGVPILYALEISEKLVDNLICGAVIKDIRDAVREGKLLADPMEKSGFFPSMTVQMIRVGEETGELGPMLDHVAHYYKGIVEDFMKHIGVLVEPIMLVVMGGVIGTIVIAMFLPLLTMSTGK